LENQEKILYEVKEMKKLLREVLCKETTSSAPGNSIKYPLLPLQTIEELKEAEATIVNEEQFKILVNCRNFVYFP
jgi:hypothetical protein